MNMINFLFKDGKPKTLTMSYDDGMVEDRRLIEIFNRNNIRGSFHLNGGYLGYDEQHIKPEEVENLYRNHEVSCHSWTHPTLPNIPEELMLAQMHEDRLLLEKLSKTIVKGMSYPNGAVSSRLKSILKSVGIVCSRTVKSTGNFSIPDDFLEWNPTCHHRENIMDKLEVFQKDYHEFLIFYVWGHSYEFTRNNNWELIENFCKAAANDSQVWYATNIEIYNYITALRSLEVSADASMIHNPSSLTLWIRWNNQVRSIAPGETAWV